MLDWDCEPGVWDADEPGRGGCPDEPGRGGCPGQPGIGDLARMDGMAPAGWSPGAGRQASSRPDPPSCSTDRRTAHPPPRQSTWGLNDGRKHVKSTRTARSALPAVERCLTASCRESGRVGLEWRESRPRSLSRKLSTFSARLRPLEPVERFLSRAFRTFTSLSSVRQIQPRTLTIRPTFSAITSVACSTPDVGPPNPRG